MSRIAAAGEGETLSSFRPALPAPLFLASIVFLNFTTRNTFSPLLPMASVCAFSCAFAVLSDVRPKGAKNVAVSLCIPLAFSSGGGILPAMIGIIGDHYSLAVGGMAAGGLKVMASACSLRLLNSSIPHQV